VLTKVEMRRIIVMHHGDKPGAESGTLLQLVEGKTTSDIGSEHLPP
jgi:dihydrodipicolinate reductase